MVTGEGNVLDTVKDFKLGIGGINYCQSYVWEKW